ncbi:hypothetical protein LDJ78_25010, partial [Citrobacter portucalensis]|nr:hypothetical protein [Citrobacter portucalensis]
AIVLIALILNSLYSIPNLFLNSATNPNIKQEGHGESALFPQFIQKPNLHTKQTQPKASQQQVRLCLLP